MKNRYEELDYSTLKRMEKLYKNIDFEKLTEVMLKGLSKNNAIIEEMEWREKT